MNAYRGWWGMIIYKFWSLLVQIEWCTEAYRNGVKQWSTPVRWSKLLASAARPRRVSIFGTSGEMIWLGTWFLSRTSSFSCRRQCKPSVPRWFVVIFIVGFSPRTILLSKERLKTIWFIGLDISMHLWWIILKYTKMVSISTRRNEYPVRSHSRTPRHEDSSVHWKKRTKIDQLLKIVRFVTDWFMQWRSFLRFRRLGSMWMSRRDVTTRVKRSFNARSEPFIAPLTWRQEPNHAWKAIIDHPSRERREDARDGRKHSIKSILLRDTHFNLVTNASLEEIMDQRVRVSTLTEDRRHFQIQFGHFRKTNPKDEHTEELRWAKRHEYTRFDHWAVAECWSRREFDVRRRTSESFSFTDRHESTNIQQFDVDTQFRIGEFLHHIGHGFESGKPLEMFVRGYFCE